MQNRDVGDVPDFGKYTLLNALCCPQPPKDGPNLVLGVVWYLTPDDKKRGKVHISSEQCANLADCDPELWNKLKRIPRDIGAIEQRQILCPVTKFYSLQTPDNPFIRESSWKSGALKATEGCDLVFLDPDTGVWAWPEKQERDEDPKKYVLLEEIPPYLHRNQSIVIYQHFREDGKDRYLLKKWSSIKRQPPKRQGFALRYDVGPVHVRFIVIPSEKDGAILSTRAQSLVAHDRWQQFFTSVSLPNNP